MFAVLSPPPPTLSPPPPILSPPPPTLSPPPPGWFHLYCNLLWSRYPRRSAQWQKTSLDAENPKFPITYQRLEFANVVCKLSSAISQRSGATNKMVMFVVSISVKPVLYTIPWSGQVQFETNVHQTYKEV